MKLPRAILAVTTISPIEKMNAMIDTTATKTGLKRWHVIVAVFGKRSCQKKLF